MDSWTSALPFPRKPASLAESLDFEALKLRYREVLSPPPSGLSRTHHSHCISRLEHEAALSTLESAHSKAIEEAKWNLLQELDQKMRFFENSCLEQYRDKVKEVEARAASTADVLELRAKLQACSLSEEILTKRYEGKLARLQLALNSANARLEQEIAQNERLKSIFEAKSRELEGTMALIQRQQRSEEETLGSERKVRLRLEGSLEKMAGDLAAAQASARFPSETEAQRRILALQRANEVLESDKISLQMTLTDLQSTIDREKESKIRATNPCSGCEISRKSQFSLQEARQWKQKTTQLVTQYYSALNKLKAQGKSLRKEVKTAREDMETQVKSLIEGFRRYYEAPTKAKAWLKLVERAK